MSAPAQAAAAPAEPPSPRRLLAETFRAERGGLLLPLGFGFAAVLAGIAQAWLLARGLAGVLGLAEAGLPELLGAAALAVLIAGLGAAQELASTRLAQGASGRLRQRILAAVLARGPSAEDRAGETVSLLAERVEAIGSHLARWIPAAVLAVAGPLAVGLAAASVDRASGLILGLAGLLVPVVMAATGLGAAAAARAQFAALSRLSGRFLDRMRGLPTLILLRAAEREAARLREAAEALRRGTMKVLRVAFLSSAGLDLIAAAALAFLAVRHGAALAAGGHPDPVGALFVLLLVPGFFAPLRAFSGAYHEAQAARGAAADLAPLLAAPPADGLLLAEVPPRVTVTFDRVCVRYRPDLPPALDNLSFRVLPGEALVLTGPSGAGKSTVLRLLMGFVRPSAGRIALNGRDALALKPGELRRLSAWVGQRAHIFRGSIADNIALARPEATRAEIEAAARAARVTDFAQALPQGLDTQVGEGGFGLSGGQAQRVAIARAFLRDRPLLLLDEPTAHLDPATEAEILESLARLAAGRTVIMATHSRAAMRFGGRVIELAAGRDANAQRMAGE
ncbi:MAG: thiol reductant ABC exporter subunit CydD [Acetobacteraceae bacterium]|nr:thiol reductant ABC exporter subunit CydD [Acetobacteraceae bacterium]MDW8399778.1 thiol reductant ABC exporter subunit CydD [Acetobacteraceae bacterium]